MSSSGDTGRKDALNEMTDMYAGFLNYLKSLESSYLATGPAPVAGEALANLPKMIYVTDQAVRLVTKTGSLLRGTFVDSSNFSDSLLREIDMITQDKGALISACVGDLSQDYTAIKSVALKGISSISGSNPLQR